MGFYLPIYHCASIFPGYHNRKHDFNSLGKTAILGEKLIIHFLNFFFLQVENKSLLGLVALLKLNMEKVSPMSSDLVMAVRFLHQLVCRQQQTSMAPALLQVFSNDICEHGISILNKVCGYHEQPHLHTATFAGYNGHLLMAVIRLVVRILKKVIDFRLATSGENFQDTTAIGTMLKTFSLCTVVSKNSDSYQTSLETCSDIVGILAAFTDVPVDMSKEKATAWQLMVTDLIKYVTLAPHTYLPGLKVLVETLPLPLPFPSSSGNGSDGFSRLVRHRHMWSAQLYRLQTEVKGMIQSLLPCSVRQVRRLLYQVCHQMADLSAPIGTMVADALYQSLRSEPITCLSNVSRLLRSPAIKVAFQAFILDNDTTIKSVATEALPSLAAVLLDTRILTSDQNTFQMGIYNALPDRESCVALINALISQGKPKVILLAMENLCQSNTGLSLVKGGVLRHKSSMLRAMESLPDDKWCLILERLATFMSQAELRELLDWPEEAKAEEHFLQSESYRTMDTVESILALLQSETGHKHEELEVEWLPSEPLLEQFAKRTLYGHDSVTDIQDETEEASEKSSDKDEAMDLVELISVTLPKDFDLEHHVKQVCDEKSLESERQKKKAAKKSLLESKALVNKNLISSFKAGGSVTIRGGRSVFNRGPGGQRPDLFRSRPPNTSRPPSLHVDDFLVLQSRGQQPTGPTGYNKQSLRAAQELFAEKEAKSKGSIVGFREATKEPVFDPAAAQMTPNEMPRNRGSNDRTSGVGGVSKNYRSGGGSSNNGRTFNRDRYSASSGSGGNPRGWSPSTNRDNRPQGGGRNAGDHRFPRRNGKGGGDSRRGGNKDRNKGKPRNSGNLRSVPR